MLWVHLWHLYLPDGRMKQEVSHRTMFGEREARVHVPRVTLEGDISPRTELLPPGTLGAAWRADRPLLSLRPVGHGGLALPSLSHLSSCVRGGRDAGEEVRGGKTPPPSGPVPAGSMGRRAGPQQPGSGRPDAGRAAHAAPTLCPRQREAATSRMRYSVPFGLLAFISMLRTQKQEAPSRRGQGARERQDKGRLRAGEASSRPRRTSWDCPGRPVAAAGASP